MSGQMAGILVLAALLLPTAGAFAGRLISRPGARVAMAITLLSFGGSAGLALLLVLAGAEFPATPGWASMLPGPGPALQTLAFDTARDEAQPAGEIAVAAVPLVVPGPEVVAAIVPPTEITRPSPAPELPTATAVLAQSNESPTFYVVQAGDTLRSIAERLGVSVQALLDANDLSAEASDRLGVGRVLRVPVETVAAGAAEATPRLLAPTSTPAPEPTPAASPEPTPTEPSAPTRVPPTLTAVPPTSPRVPPAPTVRPEPPSAEVRSYIVKQGDTLRLIAAQFGVSVDALLRFNGLSGAEGDRLSLGQRLYIPATAPRPTVVVQTYTVKQGDTLRSIAAQFRVTVDALLSFNGLSPAQGDQIRPGQKLLIPAR